MTSASARRNVGGDTQSGYPERRDRLRRLVARLWLFVLIALYYSLFTYPRVWWQDLVHGLSLALVPPLLLASIVHARALRRYGLRFGVVFALALEVACIARVGWVVRPYVTYSTELEKRATHIMRPNFLLIDGTSPIVNPAPLDKVRQEFLPEVVVVLGANNLEAPVSTSFGNYPYHLSSEEVFGSRVDIHSMWPFGLPVLRSLGVDAYPGVLAMIHVAPDLELEVGALDLQVPKAHLDYDRSRISARRLASMLRYSEYPRLVFGGFRVPVTSPTTTVYVEQLRLKSVFFNRGWSGLASIVSKLWAPATSINVFAAKSIKLEAVTEWSSERDGFRGISFSAALPSSPTSPDARREFLLDLADP